MMAFFDGNKFVRVEEKEKKEEEDVC